MSSVPRFEAVAAADQAYTRINVFAFHAGHKRIDEGWIENIRRVAMQSKPGSPETPVFRQNLNNFRHKDRAGVAC